MNSKYHKEKPEDEAFAGEYSAQIAMHKEAVEEIKKHYSTPPKSKDILTKLDAIQEKRIPLWKSILLLKSIWTIYSGYEKIMRLMLEKRWRGDSLLVIL